METVKIPDFIKEDKEFLIVDLPFPVSVKYQFSYAFGENKKELTGWPVVSHFEFRCDKKFASFTPTGYRSHFFHTQILLDYTSIEEGARELVLNIVKTCDPSEYDRIVNKKFNLQLSLF